MRIATRDLRVVTAGLVSAVLLAACSGNSSKPTVLPPLTTSATPAAATTPAPAPAPTTPSAAETSAVTSSTAPTTAVTMTTAAPNISASATLPPVSAAEASAFVKEYFKTAADALHDKAALARWKTYSLGCSLCDEDYHKVSTALAAGDRYSGGEYRLASHQVTVVKSAGAVVRVAYYVTAGKAYNSAGKLIASIKQTPVQHATMFTQHTSGQWYVLEIQVDGQ